MPSGDPLNEEKNRQHLVVMRHGIRQDEVDRDWTTTADRPWDPPLSLEGLQMVLKIVRSFVPLIVHMSAFDPNSTFAYVQDNKAAEKLQLLNVTRVVTSPFLRCYQTAVAMLRCLGLPESALELDWSVCEVRGAFCFRWPDLNEVGLWLPPVMRVGFVD